MNAEIKEILELQEKIEKNEAIISSSRINIRLLSAAEVAKKVNVVLEKRLDCLIKRVNDRYSPEKQGYMDIMTK